MNPKTFVRLSNFIGIVSILALIYWVFVFISIEVFGLKVFRENLTESFYLSIIGILALMFGALIINIMFNLTRIADKHNVDDMQAARSLSHRLKWIFILSFPLIFGLLFVGDYLSSNKKEALLVEAAQSIIDENSSTTDQLLAYTFSKQWILATEDVLEVMSKTDVNFPHVSVIVQDSIGDTQVFLDFGKSNYLLNDTLSPQKKDYIHQLTKEKRDYLKSVFEKGNNKYQFEAKDGNYTLYYPWNKDGKRMVLYFSDYQRYGKIGS
jgi:hypothetical protein